MQFNPPFPDLHELKSDYFRSHITAHRAQQLLAMDMCTMTTRSEHLYHFAIEDRFEDFEVVVSTRESQLSHTCNCSSMLPCCHHAAAAILALREDMQKDIVREQSENGESYSRPDMIKRVMREREERAEKEEFKLIPSDNIYGIHQLKTAAHRVYELTFRNFDKGNGYCSCPDYRTSKLGTCKHLIFARNYILEKFPVEKLVDTQSYPFVEVFCDPLNEYHITYFYKGNISVAVASLLERFFEGRKHILPENYESFLKFLNEAEDIKQILVRPEVTEKIEKHFERQWLKKLSETVKPDFSRIKADIFDYQKEGILFSLFKPGAIIADEMGLGKTLQAITTAVLKKDIYGLNRTLVICPASLKFQWKKEIERFTDEAAVVVEGGRDERQEIYRHSDAYFLIANYEAVMRDLTTIINHSPDMIILDEAQRIKNYTTKTSYAVKAIPKRHALVITGTPIENRLGDLYSIMNFIDPEILAPLWEFSMNHCYFDKSKKNLITGYYNLQALKERLSPWVIRREKKEVMDQLPDLQEVVVPINLHPQQEEMHAGMARTLMPLIMKKHKTIYDMQRIQQILASMRMVCDSTFLIDKETNISPKLEELQEILLEKLNIHAPGKKVIIFSEWKTMLRLIEKMLKANDIGSLMLTGDVPVKNRGKLIEDFEKNPDAKVFLASEAGGTGLNLQFADTVINFELPWNPAKKNQRIGRVFRIGQKSSKITAINLVTRNSIEQRILDGIVLKESLFNAVLNEGSLTDEVDFSKKGRATFIEQVEKLIKPFEAVAEEETREALAQDSAETLESVEVQEAIEEELQEVVSEAVQAAKNGGGNGKQADAAAASADEKSPGSVETEELETTLNQGLQFLGGLLKMTTGKDLVTEDQAVTVDKETGEVVMKFRLPGF